MAAEPARRGGHGFQLWLALPPEQELGPVESIYLTPEDIAQDGPGRVLVGVHGAAVSSLNAPASINYLAVRLKVGETWRYQRPANQDDAVAITAAVHESVPVKGFGCRPLTGVRHAPAAGVRKPPKDETAMGSGWRWRWHYGDLAAAVQEVRCW
jgi:redox-sensitive bicupin YhaK (pirin superfamily)